MTSTTQLRCKWFNLRFSFCFIVLLCTGFLHAQTERWVYRYSGVPSYRSDIANSVIYGSDGNLYAAGKSWYNATNYDFTVISLTTTGTERWVYTYNGIANRDDEAYSVVYGEDGNIYAAGDCYGNGGDTTYDFTIISLTSTGTERWVYKYNGPGNGYDYARSIVYGTDNNIYAAGCDYRFSTGYDFVVISLTNTGNERWIYRYSGASTLSDEAYSITYGADNNIYVAGKCDDNVAFVVSLTNSGIERWTYQFNADLEDYAYSVVYGGDGNIYVTGAGINQYGYEMLSNIFVICLNDSGTEQWIYEHSPPSSAYTSVYGTDNNIYVPGSYGVDFPEFMVISLTDSGSLAWEYHTPINYNGYATSIAYGLDSNIYAAGDIYDGTFDHNFAVVSLKNTGEEQWIYQYDRCGYWDFANSICYGVDNNLYAAGQSIDTITGGDFTVIGLDPSTGIEEYSPTPKLEDKFILLSTFFNEKIYIRFTSSSNLPLQIILYDVLGNVVYKSFFSSSPSFLQLDDATISTLPKGVYFLSISQDKNLFPTKKLIKF